MRFDTILPALEKWLKDVGRVAVVQAKTSQTPKPVGPYATVTLLAVHQKGTAPVVLASALDDGRLRLDYDQPHDVTVSVQIVSQVGADAGDAFWRLHECVEDLESNIWTDFFRRNGMTVLDIGDVRDIPILIENVWSQRAQVDLGLRMMGGASEVVQPIETVTLVPNLLQ